MKEKHVCKFKRLRYKSGNEVFFCTLPDCQKKMNPALCLGKRSICWRCGEEFILNEYALRLAKPHCENCHKPKNMKFENGSIIEFGPVTEEGKYKGLDNPFMLVDMEPLSLADRLQQTINAAKEKDEDI